MLFFARHFKLGRPNRPRIGKQVVLYGIPFSASRESRTALFEHRLKRGVQAWTKGAHHVCNFYDQHHYRRTYSTSCHWTTRAFGTRRWRTRRYLAGTFYYSWKLDWWWC